MPFDKAYDITMGYEGGYANDPADRGGETYKGISRRWHPKWPGWVLIDGYKKKNPGKIPSILYKDIILDQLTRAFYKSEYWDKPRFNKVDNISPHIAERLFDVGINVGLTRVSRWFQEALNLLNRNQKYYQDIKVDGGIGKITLGVLVEALKVNPEHRILNVISIFQGSHYKDLMMRDKTQERFVGWFDRLSFK